MRITVLALATLLAVGCGGRGRGGSTTPSPSGDGGSAGALTILPADPVLDVNGKNSASVTFQVLRGGQDVTARAALLLENGAFGTFSGATLTTVPGAVGKTRVRARLDDDEGSTSLTVRVAAVFVAPGTPADAPMKFGGADDPARAPSLAYPADGTLIPPNLAELEFQWEAKGNALFELSLAGDGVNLRIYTKCNAVGSGCGLEPAELAWKLLSQAARGGTVMVQVRGTSANGGPVGTSAPRTLSFTQEDMQGGLYYWAASAGGIFRYDFGLRNQQAEPFYTAAQAGAQCAGCHGLSRNGKRIGVGLNIPAPAQMRVLDVATRKKLFEVGGGGGFPGAGGSDYQAFTSDGAKIVTTEGGGLTVRDAATGALIGKSPGLDNANMPDVSPDGTRVVFARGAGSCMFGICMTLSVMSAAIVTAQFNGTSFASIQTIVPVGGANNYYPSFSPDGQLVVFNRSTGSSYDAMDAKVMVVPSRGGQVVELATANPTAASWPKWAPFTHHFGGATIFWITFSARRPVGLRAQANSQIWMMPVDAAKVLGGADSAFPALRLPFQDAGTGNHIAQWVEKVERQPCGPMVENGTCGQNEECINGVCVPRPQ